MTGSCILPSFGTVGSLAEQAQVATGHPAHSRLAVRQKVCVSCAELLPRPLAPGVLIPRTVVHALVLGAGHGDMASCCSQLCCHLGR